MGASRVGWRCSYAGLVKQLEDQGHDPAHGTEQPCRYHTTRAVELADAEQIGQLADNQAQGRVVEDQLGVKVLDVGCEFVKALVQGADQRNRIAGALLDDDGHMVAGHGSSLGGWAAMGYSKARLSGLAQQGLGAGRQRADVVGRDVVEDQHHGLLLVRGEPDARHRG